ncbi:hypothetical protein [Nocardioides sp. P5_C9_2]
MEIAISTAGALGLSLATGWFGYVFGTRQERDKERRGRNFAAGAELVSQIREVQRLLRLLGRGDIDANEVASAFLAWSHAYDNAGHRLPDEWRHIALSVRDASGTVFGGVSLVHLRPDTMKLGLAEPDAMWQDYADDYLDYVANAILRWGDSNRDAPRTLMTYEAWLVRTDRREPYGANRQQLSIGSPVTT